MVHSRGSEPHIPFTTRDYAVFGIVMLSLYLGYALPVVLLFFKFVGPHQWTDVTGLVLFAAVMSIGSAYSQRLRRPSRLLWLVTATGYAVFLFGWVTGAFRIPSS